MLWVSMAGALLFKSLYAPNAAVTTTAKATIAAPISIPLCRLASPIKTEPEELPEEFERAAMAVPAAAEVIGSRPAEVVPDEPSPATLPDSVSLFSRFRSARISEACW